MKTNRLISILTLLLGVCAYATVNGQTDYKIAEQDSLALVAFYYATDGPNWLSNQDGFGADDLSSEWQSEYKGSFGKWLEGPVKDWYGVSLELQDVPNSTDKVYRVVALWPIIGRRTDGQNRLNGYLPREMGLLTALRDFRINGNDGLMGTEIPDDFYQPTLQMIDIEAVYFTGDISDALRNCTDIRKMNFRYNYVNYLPSFDFLDRDGVYNLAGKQWLYSTQIPLSNFEKIVDYYYSISSTPKEFELEMRDVNNIGDELEIVAPLGTSVNIECTAAGEKEDFITYQWYKDGLSKFGKTKRFYTIASVKASDYGDYKVKVSNDYVKSYDYNPNWGEIYTKEIHLVESPVSPVLLSSKTDYNGKSVVLRFSKPMPETLTDLSPFSLEVNGRKVDVLKSTTLGRLKQDVELHLASPIAQGQSVSISYNGSTVADQNGGLLAAFNDSMITNLVREAPSFVEAKTTKDGSGVIVIFDKFIDAESLNVDDFTITGKKIYDISTVVLQNGLLDESISKEVLLVLSTTLSDPAEKLAITYNKGQLSALYGGVMETFNDQTILNELDLKVTSALLTFEDGSQALNDVVLKGSWDINKLQLYDDGTNGDTIANDHIWSVDFNFVDDAYTWDVYARTITQSYDTVSSVDPSTQIITQTITPQDLVKDSLLSEAVSLAFNVENDMVTGVTSFGIDNIDIVFNVTFKGNVDSLFLMGIDDDWSKGLPMVQQDDSKVYQVTLEGHSIGDVITYNYRNGNDWENIGIETRNYTVVDGDNVLNDVFADMTAVVETATMAIHIFHNPVKDILHLTGINSYSSVDIYNLAGRHVKYRMAMTDKMDIDVSNLNQGVYIVVLKGERDEVFSEKFFKLN